MAAVLLNNVDHRDLRVAVGHHARYGDAINQTRVFPAEFEELAAMARAKGFLMVSASPLTRSSYHAGDDFQRLKAARQK